MKTNRQAHEEAAGMGLDNLFFWINGINPDAEYKESIRALNPSEVVK